MSREDIARGIEATARFLEDPQRWAGHNADVGKTYVLVADEVRRNRDEILEKYDAG